MIPELKYSSLYEHPSDMDIEHYKFIELMTATISDELHEERQLDYPLKAKSEE